MIQRSSKEESEQVHQLLRGYNRQFWRGLHDYDFHIKEEGRIVAGIVARSCFETLEVEFLFVDEGYRRRGYGHKLLRHVEEAARADGLKQVLLNTYSFQAPGFYEKEGYSLLFCIENAFGEYGQWFFRKEL